MEKSKVYFTNMRASFEENLPQKMRRLMKTAELQTLVLKTSILRSRCILESRGILHSSGPTMRRSW